MPGSLPLGELLTLTDWTALPEDDRYHLECIEGVLVVNPKPLYGHQLAVTRLGAQLDEQLPGDWSVCAEVEVLLSEHPLTVRVPDVLVTTTDVAETNPAHCMTGDVLLAVEVLSQGTRRTDRVTKMSEYADAGIQHYWLVDVEPPAVTLSTYHLASDGYHFEGELTGVCTVEFGPLAVTVDLETLTRYGGRGQER